MIKKFIVLFMTLMLVSGITGCTSKKSSEDDDNSVATNKPSKEFNKTGFPVTNKKINLTMFGPNVGKAEWKDMQYFKEMKKKTNINFKFNTPPLADFEKKKNLLFASEDLPDVLYAASLSHQEEIKYGNQGVLIPLEDLIKKYAPHIQKLLKQKPEVKKAITTPDGHIYALPFVNEATVQPANQMFLNGRWLDSLNVDEDEFPKTTDGLYKLLKRFKNEDPNGNGKDDELPVSFARDSNTNIDDMRSAFLGAFGQVDDVDTKMEVLDGKVKYTPIQPGYKEYLNYMHKLWKDKLIDNEAFSHTVDQKGSKVSNNRVGLFTAWDPKNVIEGGEPPKNPMMYPVRGHNVSKPVVPTTDEFQTGQFAITKENKYPAATIRWIDYSYSQEGAVLLQYGKEGTYWDWKDKDKNLREHPTKNPPKGSDDWDDYIGTLTPFFGLGVPTWVRPEDEHSLDNKHDKWLKEQKEKKVKPYYHSTFPPVYLKQKESKKVDRIQRDLQSYVEQMEAKFITGKTPLSEWDDYVKNIKGMKVDELVDIYSDAYKRYMKN